jgi:YidC/Oxa1 family membrane protein insertase
VPQKFSGTSGWLGITDKYWAAAVVPEQGKKFDASFTGSGMAGAEHFQSDYLMGAVSVPAGGKAETKGYAFAGAKEVHLVDSYATKYAIPKFDLLIDWGWFYFLTKPMFYALDFFYKLVGNFGLAILIVTLVIKFVLFPLANKSYVSMSKMKKLQPELQRIKERYEDDRMRQQQAMMELYKKEKVNPASGCLPILVQIPVFFALYKVLFVTIEMRHAPFFGWIKDLSAPDPTSVFNLFGLLPFEPSQVPFVGHFLMIGAWPLIMGVTMWVQMKLNPAPPDPVQAKVFTWMPVFFTFLLAGFPAGLVIYWAWNNFLSVVQQSVIMSRQGVEIPLLENLGFKNAKNRAKGETEG